MSLQIQCDTAIDITPSLILRLQIFFLPYYEVSEHFRTQTSSNLGKPHQISASSWFSPFVLNRKTFAISIHTKHCHI